MLKQHGHREVVTLPPGRCCLNICLFIRPCILFKRGIQIPDSKDGFQVKWKKGGDRSCMFILEHVTTFMRQKPTEHLTMTCHDRMAECEASHIWSEHISMQGGRQKFRAVGISRRSTIRTRMPPPL